MEDARRERWRIIAILAGIILLSLAHWSLPPSKQYHNLLYHFDFIPVVAAGVLFGARGAAVATGITAVFELPQLWVVWRSDMIYFTDQVGELLVSGLAGGVVGVLSDRERTQKRKLESATRELEKVYVELRQNIDRLKRAERLSAVAQLSASLAHEIRNPLAGISGAAGILKRGNANPANQRECLEIIERESQRLNKLLGSFLDFARPRALRLQQTRLNELIDSVLSLASHSPDAGKIEFHSRIADTLPEVECDAEQVKQVLLNLVINAVQATREGAIELEAALDQDAAVIKIRDYGGGLGPGESDRIFEPFFTTKEKGTGLGLAIAANIMAQHNGTLTAVNIPGRGLDMIVKLPLRQGAHA